MKIPVKFAWKNTTKMITSTAASRSVVTDLARLALKSSSKPHIGIHDVLTVTNPSIMHRFFACTEIFKNKKLLEILGYLLQGTRGR